MVDVDPTKTSIVIEEVTKQVEPLPSPVTEKEYAIKVYREAQTKTGEKVEVLERVEHTTLEYLNNQKAYYEKVLADLNSQIATITALKAASELPTPK